MAAQFIESERGNKILLLGNYKLSRVSRPLASKLIKLWCKNET